MIRIIEKKWKVNSLCDNIHNKFKKYFDNFPFRSERLVRDDAVRTETGKIINDYLFSLFGRRGEYGSTYIHRKNN